jgi:hypothetical protein
MQLMARNATLEAEGWLSLPQIGYLLHDRDRWFIHPETAISKNWNGSSTLCVFKTHYRVRRTAVEKYRIFMQIQFSDHTPCPARTPALRRSAWHHVKHKLLSGQWPRSSVYRRWFVNPFHRHTDRFRLTDVRPPADFLRGFWVFPKLISTPNTSPSMASCQPSGATGRLPSSRRSKPSIGVQIDGRSNPVASSSSVPKSPQTTLGN